jgi:hypothetical protein
LRLLQLIKEKLLNKGKNNKDTDIVIEVQDIVHNQVPEFSNRFSLSVDEKFVCIRDMKNICIFIKESQFKKFNELELIYDKEKETVNISKLFQFKTLSDRYAQIANHTTPPSVSIKESILCIYEGVEIYISRGIILKHTDQLFQDLLDLQKIKEKCHFANHIKKED